MNANHAAERRIRQAIAGDIALADLNPHEQEAANAAIDASISARAAATSILDELAARGEPAIILDDQGKVVRRNPDGSTDTL